MRRSIIVLLTILLSLMLVGCDSSQNTTTEFDEWVDSLPLRLLDPQDTAFNQLFIHPEESLGQKKVELKWPEYSLEYNREYNATCDAIYEELLAYDREALTTPQAETYDVLKWAFEPTDEEYIDAFYYIANNPLGAYTGILSNVMITFYYLNINDLMDVKSFVNLMDDLDDFAQTLIDFEKERQDAGYGMSQDEVDMTIADVNQTLAVADFNFIVDSFIEKINKTDLEASTKEAYITQVASNFDEAMVEFYMIIKDGLESLTVKQIDDATLFDVPYGPEYYAQVVYATTGYTDMDEYRTYLESLELRYASAILEGYSDGLDGDIIYDSDDPEAVIAHLKEAMKEDFPETKDVEYKMIVAPDAMVSLMGATSAFYLIGALDDDTGVQQMTLVGDYDDSDFLTIAHEGYPGHMYQHIYDDNENDTPYIIKMLAIDGYTEGYANYVERYSAKYADDPSLAGVQKDLESFTTIMCLLLDYDMHYLGKEDTSDLAAMIGVSNDSPLLDPLIRQVQMSPGIFIKYYVSGSQIADLHDEVDEVAGKDISDFDFHTALLSHGPMPIELLRNYVLEDFSQ